MARDIVLPAGALLALIGEGAAAVPARLYATSVQVAIALVTGKAAMAAISPAVRALMESTLDTLFARRAMPHQVPVDVILNPTDAQ